MIFQIQTSISCALDNTVDGKAEEPRTPDSYLQSRNTDKCLRMRWGAVDGSLLAKWEFHKPQSKGQPQAGPLIR